MAGLNCPVCHKPVNQVKHKSGMHTGCERRLKKNRKIKLGQGT